MSGHQNKRKTDETKSKTALPKDFGADPEWTHQPINQSTNQQTNKQSHRRRITKITTSAVSYQVQGRRRCWPAHEDAHFKADRRRCNRHVDCIVNIDGQQPLKFSNNNNNNKITLAWRRNFKKKKLKRKRKEKKKENATPSRKKSKVSGVGREIRNCCWLKKKRNKKPSPSLANSSVSNFRSSKAAYRPIFLRSSPVKPSKTQ